MRKEHDSLGGLELPDESMYGIHTARALENFGDIGQRHDPIFVKAYLLVKKAAAQANAELGFLDKARADAISGAIDAMLARGRFDDIVVNPMSGGAGTSLNMNVNEVIANRALVLSGREKGDYAYIHPLDHVNMHQSTNDTYPSALKVAMLMHLDALEDVLIKLQESLQEKEKAFAGVLKLGRTELMDALPITAGMQFAAYAEAVARDRWRIFKARERIKVLNIGGTAVGTGFNAPQKYIFLVIEKLKLLTGLAITRAENMVDATQNLDAIVEVSGLVRTCAVNLMKISEDLRMLSSGPTGGIGEVVLPPVQEGSSIMPGKVNPVMCEFASQTGLLVMGFDNVVSQAAALGNLELNQFFPLVATLVLKEMALLRLALGRFEEKLVRGLDLNRDRIDANLTESVAILTYLSQYIGHDAAARIYRMMKQDTRALRQIILDEKILTGQQFDELVSPERIRMMGYRK
ncbi:MAG TPA: aspartate ammonia-lyase [Deltaproteobacteria bacterium]|nr:aspartate ammonia-lyase [Deltaproteobacteria bacterium]HPR55466.1 aspartate ammonia-lyase [Deltaproteobacteria bacterium]HXK47478.1 aspartate ammonia-lyase [Deltaproteobacteria bacterium]